MHPAPPRLRLATERVPLPEESCDAFFAFFARISSPEPTLTSTDYTTGLRDNELVR